MANFGRRALGAGLIRGTTKLALIAGGVAGLISVHSRPARAADAGGDIQPVEAVIVTAQKREQAALSVGMSITTASGNDLLAQGINSVEDLPGLVPGLTLQQSAFHSTTLTLRGVGFFNSDLSTPPAVTVYVDEAPLAYPAMASLAAFDVERVEVLKGPQGTLYGENATGGAVNYVANKPTGRFEAGAEGTYGRFQRAQLGGFVSGPIGDDWQARLALQARRGDPWQVSVTRPGDRLGRVRELQARATLQWRPAGPITSRLTLMVTHDGSDSLAGQYIAAHPTSPPTLAPALAVFPVVTTPQAADWTPVRSDTGEAFPYASDITLVHAAWRTDYRTRSGVELTSLTSLGELWLNYGQDADGTPLHVNDIIDRDGRASSFFQEVRASGGEERLRWLVGANYTHDRVADGQLNLFRDASNCRLFIGQLPDTFCDAGLFTGRMRATTYAAFGRVEASPTPQLMVETAIRYNLDRRTFDNCARVLTSNFARYWNLIRGGASPPTEIGDCFILDPQHGFAPVDNVHRALNQDSVSWRVGVNWTPRPEMLLYANASKGFKAGTVPVLGAATTTQLAPIPEESLLAYEAGVKGAAFDRRLLLETAVFYYDYRDKQLRGALRDPVFNQLEALVSIPRSHVIGAEARLAARPLPGLSIDTSVTYLQTNIDDFVGFDALANFGDHSNTPFPFSPKWQSRSTVDYEHRVSADATAFVGASVTYNSASFAGVGAIPLLRIDPYVLLDLRAGLDFKHGRYRVWLWGRNVTNTYYWNNTLAYADTVARFVGEPATYGVTLAARL